MALGALPQAGRAEPFARELRRALIELAVAGDRETAPRCGRAGPDGGRGRGPLYLRLETIYHRRMRLARLRCFFRWPIGHRWQYEHEGSYHFARCRECGKTKPVGSGREGPSTPHGFGGGGD